MLVDVWNHLSPSYWFSLRCHAHNYIFSPVSCLLTSLFSLYFRGCWCQRITLYPKFRTLKWLTLCRAVILALLSIRVKVRMGRRILKHSSASSPPPSWIHSRMKRVAAAACSSAPPAGNRKSLFSHDWLPAALRFFFVFSQRSHVSKQKK